MNFADQDTFTMGANFHGGSEVVNYPWDTWPRLTADNAWWYYVSREYADTVHSHAPLGYMNQQNNGVTDGYAWYEVNGGRQDYMNYYHYCREATIELSTTKLMPESQLVSYWNYNCRSFLNYIEQAGYGLHGLVTDSLTGTPLKAKIYISGFDTDSSYVYTDPQVGDYHRLLFGGKYDVTFSANGYFPKTISVQVTDMQTTIQNVQLKNRNLGIAENPLMEISIYPNPAFNGSFVIESDNVIQSIIVRDAIGKSVTSIKPFTKRLVVDCNWPAGLYLIQLEVQGKIINKKVQVIRN
jgi:hypothetical protein